MRQVIQDLSKEIMHTQSRRTLENALIRKSENVRQRKVQSTDHFSSLCPIFLHEMLFVPVKRK